MEQIENPKDEREFKFRLIAGSLFLLSWLVLIGMKLSSDVSLRIPLIFSIILTIVFTISIFGKRIYNLTEKLREKEENQDPLTEAEIDRIEKNEVKKMWNYVEKGTPTKRKIHNINNSVIYEHHLKLYREIDFGKERIDEIVIITNATFRKLQPVVLPSSCVTAELRDAINRISRNPDNPDIEETEMSTDAFGKPIQRTKIISHNKKEEKKEDSVV